MGFGRGQSCEALWCAFIVVQVYLFKMFHYKSIRYYTIPVFHPSIHPSMGSSSRCPLVSTTRFTNCHHSILDCAIVYYVTVNAVLLQLAYITCISVTIR